MATGALAGVGIKDAKQSAVGKRAEAASSGLSALASSGPSEGRMSSFKRGGKVKKTGPAKVHKGERVLTKKEAKKYERKRHKGK